MNREKEFPALSGELVEILKNIPKAGLGFSGGVDSSYLLYAAKTCGVDIQAYYVKSQFQPQFELDDAEKIGALLDVPIKIIPIDALANDLVRANPTDRCYYCKKVIFGKIQEEARKDGYNILMDGSNASDDAGDRPGMRALSELKVISPLREANLTKDMIRDYSKKAGLFTWNKPAYACLATRIPSRTHLDNKTLKRIEEAEGVLFKMGFSDFRARLVGDKTAKLQFPKDQIEKAAKRHLELLEALSPWFTDVLLDLKPR